MELREYLRVILRSWWLIIPLTLTALTLTLVFSYTRTPVFEAQSKYVIGFSNESALVDTADRYYILDLLAGRQQIGVNFCSAMTSGDIFGQALNEIGISDEMIAAEQFDPSKYSMNCNVLPESSVLLLITQGPAPLVVERLNLALGDIGTAAAEQIYNGMLTLQTLDSVYLEEEPISPNHTQNAVLGLALGIVVSLTASLLLEYFRSPLEKIEQASIRDPLTGAYNNRYFEKRLDEEVERSAQRNRPLSVAMLAIKTNEDFELFPEAVRDEFLHQAAIYIQDRLQQGDIVAFRGGMLFEILMPETPGYEARSRLMVVHATLRSHLFRSNQYTTSFNCKIGIVESAGESLGQVDLVVKAQEALSKAENTKNRNVHLASTVSSAFVMDDETTASLDLDLGEVMGDDGLIDRMEVQQQRQRPERFRLFGGRSAQPSSSVFSETMDEPDPPPVALTGIEAAIDLQTTLPDDDPFYKPEANDRGDMYEADEIGAFSDASEAFAAFDSDDHEAEQVATPFYEPSNEKVEPDEPTVERQRRSPQRRLRRERNKRVEQAGPEE